MKKILALILLMIALPSFAQHYHHHGYWRHGGGGHWHWVAPLIIGGVVGYEISRNQQPVIIQQTPPTAPPVPQGQVCSPWTEIRNPDGTTTYTRTCN